jgi:hypothetical protein
MGQILWMFAMEKLIVGTADGLYLIGNSAAYAEPITTKTFVAHKIGYMGCNSLPAINTEDDMLFIGPDNRTVYKLTLTQDGGYIISCINRLSDNLATTSIIDSAWQQYPRKIIWFITNDGGLEGCTYDKEGNTSKWHAHTLGGKNTYALQCETTHEAGHDLLWLIVKREVRGQLFISLEVMPPPYDPINEDIFKQMYGDSAVMVNNRYHIKNIKNSGSYFVNIEYTEDEFEILQNYINKGRGHLIIVLLNDSGMASLVYDNSEVNYFNFERDGFFIDAYDRKYIVSEESNSVIENSYMVVPISVTVQSFENKSSRYINNAVWVNINPAHVQLFGDIGNMIVLFKNTGYEGIDNRVFVALDIAGTGFFLGDETGNLVSIPLEGEFTEENQIYIGKRERPDSIQAQDPIVEFGENLFEEAVEDPNRKYHTCRMAEIKGAHVYNGQEFYLRLIRIEEDRYLYGMYYVPEDFDQEEEVPDLGPIKFVAYTSGFGIYDTLTENNGYAYFYFNKIASSQIAHLIGQDVYYSINGNWGEDIFTLTDDMIEEGGFKLERSGIVVTIGLPYTSELMPVALAGGSLFGSSEGSIGTQKEVVLMMYASLGGQYAPYKPGAGEEEILLDIPYPWSDTVDKEKQLVTSGIKVPIWGNKDPAIRTVYLTHTAPLSFNVLSIVQDVVVSDG